MLHVNVFCEILILLFVCRGIFRFSAGRDYFVARVANALLSIHCRGHFDPIESQFIFL